MSGGYYVTNVLIRQVIPIYTYVGLGNGVEVAPKLGSAVGEPNVGVKVGVP
ncbi:MAG: hypothetical protein BroJett018_11840 [Chloroflexota bacterium]|nr:MAG: hypothetical protein BroJett018_11840 [Chloroflexota bacterium]